MINDTWHDAIPLIAGVAPDLAWALDSPYRGTAILAISEKLGFSSTASPDEIVDKILIGHIDTLRLIQAAEQKLIADLRSLKVDLRQTKNRMMITGPEKEKNTGLVSEQMKRNILYITTFGVFTIIFMLMWNGKISSELIIYSVSGIITQWGLMASTVFGMNMMIPPPSSTPYPSGIPGAPQYRTPTNQPAYPAPFTPPQGPGSPATPQYQSPIPYPTTSTVIAPVNVSATPTASPKHDASDDDVQDGPSRHHRPDDDS